MTDKKIVNEKFNNRILGTSVMEKENQHTPCAGKGNMEIPYHEYFKYGSEGLGMLWDDGHNEPSFCCPDNIAFRIFNEVKI